MAASTYYALLVTKKNYVWMIKNIISNSEHSGLTILPRDCLKTNYGTVP
jgi:hypothetical protein